MMNLRLMVKQALNRKYFDDASERLRLQGLRKVSNSLKKPRKGVDKASRTGYNTGHKQTNSRRILRCNKGGLDSESETA